MEKILDLITQKVSEAFREAGYEASYGKVTVSNRPDLCQFQCNGALSAAKQYKCAPIQIANAVAQVAPASIQSFVEGSSVTVPQYASVPTAPSSPSMSRNLLIGFLVGLVVGVGAALVAYFLDSRVTQQDNLSEMFGYPLLGIIPNMDSDMAVGYYGPDHRSGRKGRG